LKLSVKISTLYVSNKEMTLFWKTKANTTHYQRSFCNTFETDCDGRGGLFLEHCLRLFQPFSMWKSLYNESVFCKTKLFFTLFCIQGCRQKIFQGWGATEKKRKLAKNIKK